MKSNRSTWSRRVAWGLLLALVIGTGATNRWWWPAVSHTVDAIVYSRKSTPGQTPEQMPGQSSAEHDQHDHSHAGHSETQSLELSAQALKNLGLTAEYLRPIELGSYQRTISVPAIVAPRPGRTQLRVSSPMSGVVMHVHAVTGEAVMPGDLLFKVRLTYEDLVETQTQFLKAISELEVENREIARLEQAVQSGAVPGKALIDRRYAKDKLEAYLTSLREALKLHGLSPQHVRNIEVDKKLLRDLSIVAPEIDVHDHDENLRLSKLPLHPASFRQPPSNQRNGLDGQHVHDERQNPPPASTEASVMRPLIIEDLKVEKGQGVMSGELLCTLSDYSELYIEGRAFEQDAPAVAVAAENGWTIDALFPTTSGQEQLSQLKLAYVANSVDPASRTLSFFVELPNQVLRDEQRSDGKRFISWKYRVGQRLQLQVPIEVWQQQIVLPVDAVVKDGADWYVFQQNGDHFDRVAVHVKYRDQRNIVIENDGSIFAGDVVARRAAHQLQMAIKNKSGAGADPHAGHTH